MSSEIEINTENTEIGSLDLIESAESNSSHFVV